MNRLAVLFACCLCCSACQTTDERARTTTTTPSTAAAPQIKTPISLYRPGNPSNQTPSNEAVAAVQQYASDPDLMRNWWVADGVEHPVKLTIINGTAPVPQEAIDLLIRSNLLPEQFEKEDK